MSAQQPFVCGIGDNVVDRYLSSGIEYPGGNACNVAVFARRSGAHAAYVGLIGTDPSAEHLLAALRAEDVDVSHVRAVSGPNSYASVRHDDRGNREFLGWEPIADAPVLDEADWTLLASADVAHTGHASFTEALLPAIAERTRVSFDFSYKDLAYAEPLLPSVWAATFSGAALPDDDARDLVATVASRGPRVVLVTRGAEGALVWADGALHHQPAAPAEVVDTLGAGDAFTARLLVGLLRREGLAAAASAASAMAARVCEGWGAFGRGRAFESREVAR